MRSALRPPAPAAAPLALAFAVWGLAAVFYAYAFAVRVSPSVMVDSLMRDFAASATIVGNLSAIYFYSYAVIQLPVGMLVDRFGALRVLTVAAVLCGAGGLLFAAAPNLAVAYAGRLLVGLGAGFSWIGALKVATEVLPANRFAFFGGMTALVGGAGTVAAQTLLAPVVEAAGWRPVMLGMALLSLGLAALLGVAALGARSPSDAAGGLARQSFGSGIVAILKTGHNWLTGTMVMLLSVPMLAFAGLWGVPYVATVFGVDRTAAAVTASMMIVGWAVGAPVLGWVADRLGRRRIIVAASLGVLTASLAAAIYVPGIGLGLLRALLLVAGLATGCVVVAFSIAREHNRPETVGTALSLINAMGVASGAIFQPLIGWALDLAWDGSMASGIRLYSPEAYRIAFALVVGSAALSFALAFFLREREPMGRA